MVGFPSKHEKDYALYREALQYDQNLSGNIDIVEWDTIKKIDTSSLKQAIIDAVDTSANKQVEAGELLKRLGVEKPSRYNSYGSRIYGDQYQSILDQLQKKSNDEAVDVLQLFVEGKYFDEKSFNTLIQPEGFFNTPRNFSAQGNTVEPKDAYDSGHFLDLALTLDGSKIEEKEEALNQLEWRWQAFFDNTNNSTNHYLQTPERLAEYSAHWGPKGSISFLKDLATKDPQAFKKLKACAQLASFTESLSSSKNRLNYKAGARVAECLTSSLTCDCNTFAVTALHLLHQVGIEMQVLTLPGRPGHTVLVCPSKMGDLYLSLDTDGLHLYPPGHYDRPPVSLKEDGSYEKRAYTQKGTEMPVEPWKATATILHGRAVQYQGRYRELSQDANQIHDQIDSIIKSIGALQKEIEELEKIKAPSDQSISASEKKQNEESFKALSREEKQTFKKLKAEGKYYQEQKQNTEALQSYQKAMKIFPQDPELRTHFAQTLLATANTYFLMNQEEKAIQLAKKALEVNPQNSNAIQFLNTHAVQYKQQKISTEQKKLTDLARQETGLRKEAQENLQAAIAHYEQALEIDPGLSGSHYNLGIAIMAASEMDPNNRVSLQENALQHYKKSAEINPHFMEPLWNLGGGLARTGDELEEETQGLYQTWKTNHEGNSDSLKSILQKRLTLYSQAKEAFSKINQEPYQSQEDITEVKQIIASLIQQEEAIRKQLEEVNS